MSFIDRKCSFLEPKVNLLFFSVDFLPFEKFLEVIMVAMATLSEKHF